MASQGGETSSGVSPPVLCNLRRREVLPLLGMRPSWPHTGQGYRPVGSPYSNNERPLSTPRDLAFTGNAAILAAHGAAPSSRRVSLQQQRTGHGASRQAPIQICLGQLLFLMSISQGGKTDGPLPPLQGTSVPVPDRFYRPISCRSPFGDRQHLRTRPLR